MLTALHTSCSTISGRIDWPATASSRSSSIDMNSFLVSSNTTSSSVMTLCLTALARARLAGRLLSALLSFPMLWIYRSKWMDWLNEWVGHITWENPLLTSIICTSLCCSFIWSFSAKMRAYFAPQISHWCFILLLGRLCVSICVRTAYNVPNGRLHSVHENGLVWLFLWPDNCTDVLNDFGQYGHL